MTLLVQLQFVSDSLNRHALLQVEKYDDKLGKSLADIILFFETLVNLKHFASPLVFVNRTYR